MCSKGSRKLSSRPDKIRLKSPREIAAIGEAGRIVADTLVMLRAQLRPGISTLELDRLAAAYLRRRGAISSYGSVKFDGVVCVSINDEVVHGIPGRRTLRQGDLVSLDIAAIYAGYHADASLTASVGAPRPEARRLLAVTEAALALGISLATPGRPLYDISSAIQEYVERHGYGVVRNLSGHGIGRSMWEEPVVPNYAQDERGPLVREGMVFTIEPMVTAGDPEVAILPDKWTIISLDHSLAAHFEHTIVVLDGGPRILTEPTDPHAAWAMRGPAPERQPDRWQGAVAAVRQPPRDLRATVGLQG